MEGNDHALLVNPPTGDAVLMPGGLFGNEQPVELEIGCGKGGFLVEVAKSHPQRNYLGIEWAAKYARYIADRLTRRGLRNARIMRHDASVLVRRQLPNASIAGLHLYHPDPWPKKKHHKKRIVQPTFVRHAARILQPRAVWRIQTDHAEYFEWIVEHVRSEDARRYFDEIPFTPAVDLPLPRQPGETDIARSDPEAVPEGSLPTNFALKFRDAGSRIHCLALQRNDAAWE